MKSTYAFLVTVLLLSCVTSSCDEDFLEKRPFASVSEATLANKAGVDALLIGAYSLLDSYGAVGHGSFAGWGYLIAPDDARMGSESGVSEINAFILDPAFNRINDRWRFQYAAIDRCNEVLKMLPKVTDATPEQKLQIEAETRFLRGVYYFYLVALWKNVPWIDETIGYAEGNYFVSNVAENIWLRVEADFAFAGDNLTETKAEVGRANKWAAKAFLAKTYMFQKKFAQAKPVLDDVIANGQTSNGKKYGLQAKYNDNFITEKKHSEEAVFTVQMSVNDGADGANGNNMDRQNGPFGSPAVSCCGWFQPTFDLVDAYQTDPVTGLPLLDTYQDTPIPHDNGLSSTDPFTPYTGTLDARLDWTVGRRGIPYRDWGVHPGRSWIRSQFTSGPYSEIKHIAPQSRPQDRQGGGNLFNSPLNLIRFADVLLWAAECEVEVGSLAKAEEYVNMVRERAANPDGFVKTYINPTQPLMGFTDTPAANYFVGLYTGQFEANGQSYARKAVRFERRLELAMEHHRYLDLLRYDGNDFDLAVRHNWVMEREQRDMLNPNSNYVHGKFMRGRHELFPIPQAQIDLSVKDGESVLVQNPGW